MKKTTKNDFLISNEKKTRLFIPDDYGNDERESDFF